MSRVGGIVLLQFSGQNPAPFQGRSAGAHFDWPKWAKSHLGRSPLSTPLGVRGWNCVKAMVGPSPLLWRLVVPLYQASLGSWPYGWVVSTSGPTLAKRRSRRRKPGHQPLGTVAHQGKALGEEGCTSRGVGGNPRTESHPCDHTSPRAEKRRTQGLPVPQGGFHKAGEGPAFGGLW